MYEALSIVNRSLDYYFALKAIDSLQTSATTDSGEDKSKLVSKIIESLIDDNQLKKIITNIPIVSTSYATR